MKYDVNHTLHLSFVYGVDRLSAAKILKFSELPNIFEGFFMNDVTKRFFETIEAAGITPYRISKDIPSITQGRISNARQGANEIGIDTVSAVCEYYRNINGNYILTGRGTPLFLSEEETSQVDEIKPDSSKVLDIWLRFMENQKQGNEIMREMSELYKQIKGE